MDAFKIVVAVCMVLAVVAVGFIVVVTNDAIEGAKIPDQEYGTIQSKAAVTDGQPADYMITLAEGKVLYIQTKDNATLYGTLKENVSYVFNCRIDYKNQMTLIFSATQQNRTMT
jgi:hypothetical protein